MKAATARINMARFAAAVREGLDRRTLAQRFGIHYTTAAELARAVLKKEPPPQRRDA